MKSLIARFTPGLLLGTVILAALAVAHAQTKAEPAAVVPQSVTYAPAAPQAQSPAPGWGQPAPMVVCGQCGAELNAPRAVLVASPVGGVTRHGWRAPGRAQFAAPESAGYYAPDDCAPEPDRLPPRTVVYFVGGTPPIPLSPFGDYPAAREYEAAYRRRFQP